jgi:sirohydrochlorin cobaltochelatase
MATDAADVNERDALALLDARLKLLLPPEYQDGYDTIEPKPMRSAGLKYDAAGNVAWDRIWGSFCDLAMAGGPPHKGALLAPGAEAAIDADFGRYDEVVEEICRGISMVTGLRAYASPELGWVRVSCDGEAMAGWLLRAITMENVAVRQRGVLIELPAAPHFRLEKEIKNVVTVAAKTCHYWLGHIPREQQEAIGDLFVTMSAESPLICASGAGDWRAVDCHDVRCAVWMMRALVACNVAARREGSSLMVPVVPAIDPDGAIAANAVSRVRSWATVRGICRT